MKSKPKQIGKMPAKRGGARKGSGRKPRTVPRVPITVRLEPEDAARLRSLCRAAGCSQADWVAAAVNESPNVESIHPESKPNDHE